MKKFPYAIVEGKTVLKITHDTMETAFENLPKDDNGNLLKRPFQINETIPSEYEEGFYYLETWLDVKPKRVIQRYVARKIDINELYLLKKEEVNVKLDSALSTGVTHDGHWYQADTFSLSAIASNAVEAQAATVKSNYTVKWYDAKNEVVEHDKTSFIELHRKINAFHTTLRSRARVLKDDLLKELQSENWDALKNHPIVFISPEEYDENVTEAG
jgi:hypothetical protein